MGGSVGKFGCLLLLPQGGHRAACTLCEIATRTRSLSLGFSLAPTSRDAYACKTFRGPKAGHPAPAAPDRCQPPYQSQSVFSLFPICSHHLTLSPVDASKPPPVKFQEIVRDGTSTIVRGLSCCAHTLCSPTTRSDGSRSLLYVFSPFHRVPRAYMTPLAHCDPAWRRSCFHSSQTRHWRDLCNHNVPCRIPHRS